MLPKLSAICFVSRSLNLQEIECQLCLALDITQKMIKFENNGHLFLNNVICFSSDSKPMRYMAMYVGRSVGQFVSKSLIFC